MEKVIFGMPADPELFLAATAAVQAWGLEQNGQKLHALREIEKIEKQSEALYNEGKQPYGAHQVMLQKCREGKLKNAERGFELTIAHRNINLDFMHPVFGTAERSYEFGPVRGDWDLAFDFDIPNLYDMARPTERNAAIMMSNMLGASGGSMPDLTSIEVTDTRTKDVLFVPEGLTIQDLGDLEMLVQKNKPEATVGHGAMFLREAFNQVANSRMVVGRQCFTTYVAAALGKKVVEIVGSDKYRRWMSKWDNPNYQMVYGDCPAHKVWNAMEVLWDRPVTVMSIDDQNEMILTEIKNSISGLAVAQSEPDRI